MYITRPASKEIFSPSNKIHWEVGRARTMEMTTYKTERRGAQFFYGFLELH
jgi:hypothetical protein